MMGCLEIAKNKISAIGSCFFAARKFAFPATRKAAGFFDAIFPKRCVACGTQGEWLCRACSELQLFRPQQDCLVCGRHNADGNKCVQCVSFAHTRRVLCAFSYRQGALVKLVKMFKYDFVKSVGPTLEGLLADFISKQTGLVRDALVLPVPLHHKRLRWRGYNQSAILAEALARRFDWCYDARILKRHKMTKPQAKLETEARCLNVDGCFSVRPGIDLAGKRIVLVDDVVTTGATIEACALALKRAGARSVDVVALIRG